MSTTEATKSLAEALARFQAQLPAIGKGARGQVKGRSDYRYADLADISAVVLPLLASLGLAWLTLPTVRDGEFVLEYQLVHESGERIGGWYPLRADGGPQARGSEITYARRYCLAAVTGIAPDDDDDGAAAQAHHGETQQPRRAERRPAEPPRQAQPERKPEEDAAQLARRAAEVFDQAVVSRNLDALTSMWRLAKRSTYADVDVSGLLTDDDRERLGIEVGTEIGVQKLVAKVGAYVKDHGRALRDPLDDAEEEAQAAAEQEAADDAARAE